MAVDDGYLEYGCGCGLDDSARASLRLSSRQLRSSLQCVQSSVYSTLKASATVCSSASRRNIVGLLRSTWQDADHQEIQLLRAIHKVRISPLSPSSFLNTANYRSPQLRSASTCANMPSLLAQPDKRQKHVRLETEPRKPPSSRLGIPY